MSDLHGQIMNIQVESKRLGCCIDDVMFANKPDIESMITFAYKIGHRDARHAAAEMSIPVQAQRDELLAAANGALTVLIQDRDHTPMSMRIESRHGAIRRLSAAIANAEKTP